MEGCGLESYLGLRFFPSFYLMQTMYHVLLLQKTHLQLFFFVQEEEHYQIKCCQCNAVLGSGSAEEKNHSSLHMELHDFTSINLHKHRISLRHSHLFRYSMLNVIWEEINTESIRKLSYFNFLWSKTLYQNNLKNSAFLFTFFKGYRLM